ncbi:ADP-ribose pyrophosphatase YjhB, NUDIX family [Desulfuromonas soudanensis]|uniref:ADP-ribose pyrophosphatase YjhB, NUDIX family n=1 Tax=Desulfuromonas soudanensis TaxID=1603606 RepID=A0A0M5IKN2_9BACT|nr:NUDIX hydrolase [Desulfuromonas soudanensis]ALC15706.1 ADP-ribose pyrophosphatase YjhB, NUDIX family [Desulfuromonas soudanensis]
MDYKKQAIKTSVVACIIDAEDRVLLTRRCIHPFCDQWVMPGGKIDLGEGIIEALHREVREEVGIEIRVEGLIDVFEHLKVGSKNDHFVILYYRAVPLSAELRPNGSECTEAIWVHRDQLHPFDLTPGSRHILAKIFPGIALGGNEALPSSALGEVPGGAPPRT